VRIGQITAQSQGLIPSFELALRDITFARRSWQAARHLRFACAGGSLSATPLLSSGFEQLVIDQPVLDISSAAARTVKLWSAA
jgi:hypothetical protein